MWSYNYTNGDELYHYGRKGMKWGQHIFGRLYKNKDGTLTALGRKRAQKYAKKYKQLTGSRPTDSNIKKNTKTTNKKSSISSKPEQRQISDMTDDELIRSINRLNLENKYKSLQPETVSRGKKIFDKVIAPAATTAGKQLLQEWMINEGRKALGLPANQNNQKKKNNNNNNHNNHNN